MKKFIGLIGMIAVSANCLAANNLIYCPEKITCAINGAINSCQMSDGAENWPKIYMEGGFFGPANAVYNFDGFNFTGTINSKHLAYCVYRCENTTFTQKMIVDNDKLIPYMDNSNGWYAKDINNKYNSMYICKPEIGKSVRLECPFQYG